MNLLTISTPTLDEETRARWPYWLLRGQKHISMHVKKTNMTQRYLADESDVSRQHHIRAVGTIRRPPRFREDVVDETDTVRPTDLEGSRPLEDGIGVEKVVIRAARQRIPCDQGRSSRSEGVETRNDGDEGGEGGGGSIWCRFMRGEEVAGTAVIDSATG